MAVMTRSKFRAEMRLLVYQYLDSNVISPNMYIKTVAHLVDSMPEKDQKEAEELGQEIVNFFQAIYNYYEGFIEVGGGWITAESVKENKMFRERELRTMRYVKGLFRKGAEFGSMLPC